jgi:hypothetical protein
MLCAMWLLAVSGVVPPRGGGRGSRGCGVDEAVVVVE